MFESKIKGCEEVKDVKEECFYSDDEQLQRDEMFPEHDANFEEGECPIRVDSELSDDEWKPESKTVKSEKQGGKTKAPAQIATLQEEQGRVFDKHVNVEILLRQINANPEQTLKQMELSGIPVYHYPCDHCGKSCSQLQQYADHIGAEHPGKVDEFNEKFRTFQCFHCKEKFLSRKDRRAHIAKSHKDSNQSEGRSHRVFICPHCKVKWKSAKNTKMLEAFLEHLIRHELGSKGLWCESCPDKFDTFNTLRRHVLGAHLSNQIVCPQCGEICSGNNALKKHNQKAHTIKEKTPKKKVEQEEVHFCDICAKQFDSQKKLWYHKSTAHRDPSKYFTCDVCGKKLADKTRFEDHTTLHRPPTIACSQCGRLFHTEKYLDRHVKSQHTSAGELRFHCDQCGKGFYSSQKMSDHMNVHLGAKPYACRCLKVFFLSFSLFCLFSDIAQIATRTLAIVGTTKENHIQIFIQRNRQSYDALQHNVWKCFLPLFFCCNKMQESILNSHVWRLLSLRLRKIKPAAIIRFPLE